MDDVSAFDTGDAVPEDRLEAIRKVATEAVELEGIIASAQEMIKASNVKLNGLKSKDLPDALAEVGMKDFTLEDGSKIKVEDFISASLPKDPEKRQKAIETLVEHDAEEIIKNQIVIQFDRSQHNEALDLAGRLRDDGYPVEVESNVHPQTLKSLLREKLKNGEDFPFEDVGAFVGRTTKITLPK